MIIGFLQEGSRVARQEPDTLPLTLPLISLPLTRPS
jgi:hypothetical protein